MIISHNLLTEATGEPVSNGPKKQRDQSIALDHTANNIQNSPKSIQTTKDSQDSQSAILTISSQSSVSSSTYSKLDAVESPTSFVHNDLSQSYVTDLVKGANELLESKNEILVNEKVSLLIKNLSSTLIKSRSEANHYKIKAELLSISSKDADARYEVENEIIKREVDRLKNQNDGVEYLMNKMSRQRQTLKKYKNEIINKNKEILNKNRELNKLKIKLNNLNSDGVNKRRKKSSPSPTSNPNMLDTLGLLASQVLTEEEKYDKSLTNSFPR